MLFRRVANAVCARCSGRAYVARGCDYSDSYTDLGCIYASTEDEKASLCYCDTVKCNTAPTMTSSLGHVIATLAPIIVNAIAAHLL